MTVYESEITAIKELYNATNGQYWLNPWDYTGINNCASKPNCSLGSLNLYGVTCDNTSDTILELQLQNNSLNGTIPESIGNLKDLTILYLYHNHLTGGIPKTIFSLTKLQHLALHQNKIHDSIPTTIGDLRSLVVLSLFSNDMSGTITDAICNLTLLNQLHLSDNKLSSIVPNCIGNLASLAVLELGRNNLFGTIPNSIGNLTNLTNLDVSYNNLTGSIPSSITNLVKINAMFLEINHLSGTIPEMMKLKALVNLSLDNNELCGTIPSSIFLLDNLTTISLHSNQFTGTISPLISNLKDSLINFDVSNNKLHGTIPDSIGSLTNLQYLMLNGNQLTTNDTSRQTSLKYFVASNCDLCGSLPNNSVLANRTHMTTFTIHNNRLSCSLMNNLKKSNDNETIVNITIVLSSDPKTNLSLFRSIQSFDISKLDPVLSVSMVSVAGLSMIVIFVVKIFFIWQKCKSRFISHSRENEQASVIGMTTNNRSVLALVETRSITSNSDSSLLLDRSRMRKRTFMALSQDVFIGNMQSSVIQFMQSRLMLCLLVLIGIYIWNSHKFTCCLILDRLSLNYYYTYNNDLKDWIVLVTLTILYFILCNNIVRLHENQLKRYDRLSNADYESIRQDNNLMTFNETRLKRLIWLLGFLLLFLLANVFVIFSIVVDNLPRHNILRINNNQVNAISISLPFALSINTAVIIPKFVDSCYKCICLKRDYLSTIYITKYRPLIILLLRSVSMILVPIISSVVLIPNCGNYWVIFWDYCKHGHIRSDVTFSNPFLSAEDVTNKLTVTVLNICDPSLKNIEWDKCIRTFSLGWSWIVTQKLSFMVLLPFVVIAKKFITFELMKCIKNLCSRINICNCRRNSRLTNQNSHNDQDDTRTDVGLKIDLEYANLLTMLESMIIWCPISPLIAPLTMLSIYSNYLVYRHAIHKYHWSVYPFDNDVRLPIYVLWISIVLSQTYICLFMWFCFEHEYTVKVFEISMFVVDVLFLFKHCCGRRR